MGWTEEGSEFEYRYGQDFSPLHDVKNRFWDSLSLLSNEYQRLFSKG
jgi:hypothetical protein